MLRKTYVQVDLSAIAHNIRQLKRTANTQVMAVVKADAYGHGMEQVARVAMEEGVEWFAVATADEAVKLRDVTPAGHILLLSAPEDVQSAAALVAADIAMCVYTPAHIRMIAEQCALQHKQAAVHIKIDTGMHRIGLFKNEVQNVLDLLLTHGAKVEGIFTHYACSDCNQELTQRQYDEFKSIVESLNYPFKYIHTSNTDATVNFNDEISTHVRCGLGILGYSSFESDLKPVVSLYTHINNTKCLPKDQSLSYGHHYTTSKDEYISTLTIGYADGLWRKNTLRHVYVEDEYATIVGNVCMDQLMIRTNQYHPFGTLVEIFGNHISLYDMAKELDTIPYEILTSLSDRVDRVYTYNNEIILKYNPRYNGLMEDLCV